MTQRELSLGEREIAKETIARVDSASAPSGAPSCCARRCRDRGWACQSEPGGEARIDRIFDGPGAEGGR